MADTERDASATVLVVEDEVLLRLALADNLRDAGFTVIEAANGEEARAVLMAGVHVSLVFSDINMPGDLDGVGLAQWIGSNQAETPVVLTSGLAQSFAVARTAAPLVKMMIAKPYDHDALIKQLRTVIAQRAKG